jgi:hypothetical protein
MPEEHVSEENRAREDAGREGGVRQLESLPGVFDQIRSRCAEVSRRATHVRIDDRGLQAFAEHLASQSWPEDDLDPAHFFVGDEAETLAFVIMLDAINFGSGWFPVLRKRPRMSGYRTIATACRDHFEAHGTWTAEALRSVTPEVMAELLGQDMGDPELAELLRLYARAWRDLGVWLAREFDDCFEAVVESANGSAERLVSSLAMMPLYRDVSPYGALDIPFYKRAQITVADLHRAFGDDRFGRFDDLDSLTLFADNLVPHVLRCGGVLVYADSLASRIDAEELIAAHSREEVEIRAVAVEAVERLVSTLARLGRPTTARALDGILWNAGQASAIKARPRHRTRSSYY